MPAINTKYGIEVYEVLEERLLSGDFIFIASTGKLFRQWKCGKLEEVGSLDNYGYRKFGLSIDGKRHIISVARFVFFLTHGRLPAEGKTVDHINRDKLDNRPSNLREASDREQSINRGWWPKKVKLGGAA